MTQKALVISIVTAVVFFSIAYFVYNSLQEKKVKRNALLKKNAIVIVEINQLVKKCDLREESSLEEAIFLKLYGLIKENLKYFPKKEAFALKGTQKLSAKARVVLTKGAQHELKKEREELKTLNAKLEELKDRQIFGMKNLEYEISKVKNSIKLKTSEIKELKSFVDTLMEVMNN